MFLQVEGDSSPRFSKDEALFGEGYARDNTTGWCDISQLQS